MMTFKLRRTYGKCTLLYQVVIADRFPNNIPVEYNLFKWAFSASQSQRNLTGSLLANSTNDTKTFMLNSHLFFSLRKIQISFAFREMMS